MTHLLIPDYQQRLQALNPTQSFIVQAPAGSGKTELLTQRFLALMSTVKQPEEILAITFTKKSAAEMRARIINALNHANHEPEPTTDHAKATWTLAKKVLARDAQLNWHLLKNPNRLRIQTIDSFNAYLTKQLPILAHFGSTPDISDDTNALYHQAAREFLSYLNEHVEWSDAIAQLLLHMDNDLDKVEDLLVSMLSKRDQWLPYITAYPSEPELRQRLESGLQAIIHELLQHVKNAFPAHHADEFLKLVRFSAGNLAREEPTSIITRCKDLDRLPDASPEYIDIWLSLAELLVRKGDKGRYQWRIQYNKNLGFPAPSHAKNPIEKKELKDYKDRMEALVKLFSDHESLRIALEDLILAPSLYYDDSQWKTLEALHQALKLVVAQLYLTFQTSGKIDYIESAQAALLALGTDDLPTDLTLALDYQLRHILIDEFQDTSHTQFKLIEKLTAGWTNQDGRTLFLVGDPMQSIYRFREADVGLFIRVRTHGLGHLRLTPLTLAVNFRSTPGIVNWINNHFKHVLPSFENMSTGAITYSPSIANQVASSEPIESAVMLHAFTDTHSSDQANEIVTLIQSLQNENLHSSIAILVRSRSHLNYIIPALKHAHIPYRAIDIDPLDSKPIIQDLLALTRALLHPADKIAWLAILRAPWCGLLLSDLHALVGTHSKTTLYERLQSQSVLSTLSNDGQQRINRIFPIFKSKWLERYRYPLRTWVESTWQLLGGPACVLKESDLHDANTFFSLLESLDQSGNHLNITTLIDKVKTLYAETDQEAETSLQIMTIHNAKGLEFDTVIIPHLEKSAPHDDKSLLLWMEQSLKNSEHSLLIAPVNAVGKEPDPIYEYIKRQHAIKLDHEAGRLLYVAATRAKKQLHLFFSLKKDSNDEISSPSQSSLLGKCFDAISKDAFIHHTKRESSLTNDQAQPMILSRLASTWQNPIQEQHEIIRFHNDSAGFKLPNYQAKYVGTLIHSLIEKLCEFGTIWWTEPSYEQKYTFIQSQLTQLGVKEDGLAESVQFCIKAIDNMVSDTRGQWILKKWIDAKSEWSLTSMADGRMQSITIDRSFIDDQGVRWIIDYKSTYPSEEAIETFLIEQKALYCEKMLSYANAICTIDTRPIKLGLYFPLVPAWHEWELTNV